MTDPRDEGPPRDGPVADGLIVEVGGFEGPLDLLLALARRQSVDLAAVSVLDLARQYLAFVETARGLRIELAADYLVTAAWLAFLKSRLLLPPDPTGEGPTAEAMAAHLTFQLRRLEAMRRAGAALLARPRLGRDVHPRGAPDVRGTARRIVYETALPDLLRGYVRVRTRDDFRPHAVDRRDVLSLEEALEALRDLVGRSVGWTDLAASLPDGWTAASGRRRAALAATFAASLELAKRGAVEIRQDAPFGAIALRRRP